MAYLLGWKDILRPIRDGYHHLFPSPDTGPTPEERRKQRELERLKGFTYFDTFEQLEAWTEDDADPLQRSNTPLLVRSVCDGDDLGKADILLCHDYAGNYHDYEDVSNIGLEKEKYTCEYLQYVNTFIYFSHKLVCVPPPTWTNTLHRNGVKALGTILIEPQTLNSERLLQHGDDRCSFVLATKLANIAHHYGFDGWLVNIEKPFPTANWNTDVLEAFLCQLRSDLRTGKQSIWYDALTTSNKVSYQNGLSAQNLRFTKACGSILTNYCWKESDIPSSINEALQKNLSPQQVYFGIDVWAQNTTKLSHPRITYPESGGGGTNTGVAVAKLAGSGLSAGIFAPAWTFEHFPGHGRDVEQMTWEGTDLPEGIDCSCGDCGKRHLANRTVPITKFARQYSAGSETFFFTDFSRAFSTHNDKERDNVFSGFAMHAQLGSQSILPPRAEMTNNMIPLRHRLEDVLGRPQLMIEAHCMSLSSIDRTPLPDHPWLLPLFKFDMPADGSLRLRISYRDFAENISFSFYMKVSGTVRLFPVNKPRTTYVLDTVIRVIPSPIPHPRLQELGIYVKPFSAKNTTRLAEVDFICIKPIASEVPTQTHNISNIHTSSRGEGETQHLRLCWNYASSGRSVKSVPCSNITGPFSYFAVHIDELSIGRAYATEHILPDSLVKRKYGRKVSAKIEGIGFDGQKLTSTSTLLQL